RKRSTGRCWHAGESLRANRGTPAGRRWPDRRSPPRRTWRWRYRRKAGRLRSARTRKRWSWQFLVVVELQLKLAP
ncbi:hypothetical protein HMPREF0072_0581, partial [Anaerococcus lactolyticus ATCC 51172]